MTPASFSRGERERTRRFFNLASVVYPLIDRQLGPVYRYVLSRLDLDPASSVLDLATGTGTLAGAFAQRGHATTGVDFATHLLRRARRRVPTVTFREMDLADLEQIPDSSFGTVSMGFFLHGVDAEFRAFVLGHAARIACDQVVVVDYGSRGNLLVRFIEWVEGSRYHEFLAASRADEFRRAGLGISREVRTRGFGQAWLCRSL